MDGFSSGDAMRVSGIPYPRLDYWARSGFLKPSLATAKGKGTDRRYSLRDLIALRVANELRKEGVSLQKLRRVVGFLKTYRGSDGTLASARLVLTRGDVLIRRNDEQVVSALKEPGQSVLAFVVDLGSITGQVERMVKAIRRSGA